MEDLNTVLDDNRKLCLSSGEIMKLSPYMSILFEVDNLSQASPATVSRCGMVHMEPGVSVNWKLMKDKWIADLPVFYNTASFVTLFDLLFDYFFPAVLKYSKEQERILNTESLWLVQNFLKLYESMLLGEETRQEQMNALKEMYEKEFMKIQREKQVKAVRRKNLDEGMDLDAPEGSEWADSYAT